MNIRDAIVEEALSWVKTPYHHLGKIKGVGVDCGQILIEVYGNVGLTEKFDTGYYPLDWALHKNTEKYFSFVEQYCSKVDVPQKGDICLYKFGRCISHSGILIDDEGKMVHALLGVGVIIAHHLEGDLKNRFFGYFRVNGVE